MNSPYPERKQLNISIQYKPYIVEKEKSVRNLKFDLLKISERLSEFESEVVEDYESYVASSCTYCKKLENGELIKCLRHHTVSFDLPNVIDLKSNRRREVTIRYGFDNVYKPIYVSIRKEGWYISLFTCWKYLVANVSRPSGIVFTYTNINEGKSVYLIVNLIKNNIVDFIRKELGTPYISVTIQ